MSAGDFPATSRLRAGFALIGLLALIVGLGAASAQAGGGNATTAKKCKKKSRSASVAKKKCKKKGQAPINLPAPPPIPPKPPVVVPPPAVTNIDHVTLTWNANPTAVDLDLHIWNRDGAHSGWEPDPLPDGDVYDDIPGGTHSADGGKVINGSEEFTDANPSSHEVTIVVCYQSSDGMPDPTIGYTLTISYSDGNPDDVINETGFDQGQHNQYDDGSATFYEPTDPCHGV